MSPYAKLDFARLGPPVILLLLSINAFTAARERPKSKPKAAAPPEAETITFVEVTSKLGIALPALVHPSESGDHRPITTGELSLDYVRQHLIPSMGGSIAAGDVDGDGHRSLYVVVPGGGNHLLREGASGTFADVTAKAKVGGSGSDLGAAFGDFDHSGRLSLFVAGLGGVRLYRNEGGGLFSDVTEKAGLKGKSCELAASVLLFDADG
ncbi:MAG: VCBS repeat-containing protein, partial [Candidatus Sulfotelmatobacter sp.]